MYRASSLENRMLEMYAARQRTKEKEMILTDKVGTIYRHKKDLVCLIKCNADGDTRGVVNCLDAQGTMRTYAIGELDHCGQLSPITIDVLCTKLRTYVNESVGKSNRLGTSESDGSTANYYDLPAGAETLQDLLSYRNMNHAMGEIFCATYRYGRASHSDQLRDAKKIKFYIEAEIKRLEKLNG